MSKALTIGHVARIADVNVETVRYYQRIGLIQQPYKPPSGYRIYSDEIADRIKFVKRAQALGFSLHEIAELLDFGEGRCIDMRERAEEKRAHIEQQIHDLTKLRDTLDSLIISCRVDSNNLHCPIVETLTGKR